MKTTAIISGLHPKAPVTHFFTDFESAKSMLESETVLSLDLETSGLSPWKDWIAVVALYGPQNQVACILHVAGALSVMDDLKAWLGSPERTFITHNGSTFDILFLAMAGVNVDAPTWRDTMIAEQVIVSTNRRGVSKNLQSSIKRRLGVDIDKNVDHKTWLLPKLDEQQLKYVAEDISFSPALWDAQMQVARESDVKWGRHDFYNTGTEDAIDFEHEVLPAYVTIQLRGLPVDEEALSEYAIRQSAKADMALQYLHDTAGKEWNPGSHVQVKRIMQEVWGIELLSTAEAHLLEAKELFAGSPALTFIDTLLTYRHASKRAGMYGPAFVEKFVHEGWVHGRFRQMGTDTGRTSSSEPNMQQFPKGEDGARHVFGNLPGHKIVSVDYSQIEIRVAADMAGDKNLISLLSERDVHTMIAAQVFNIPPEDVTKDQRRLSKAMSFTLLFGGGAPLLSAYAKTQGANLPLSVAEPLVRDFFDQFQGLRTMRAQAYSVQRRNRPFTLKHPTGFRRVLIPGEDLRATRILNNMVQGAAAAGMKMAIVEAHKQGLTPYIGALVHDEIVATVPTAMAPGFAEHLEGIMVQEMSKICSDAPVAAEAEIGDTWG